MSDASGPRTQVRRAGLRHRALDVLDVLVQEFPDRAPGSLLRVILECQLTGLAQHAELSDGDLLVASRRRLAGLGSGGVFLASDDELGAGPPKPREAPGS